MQLKTNARLGSGHGGETSMAPSQHGLSLQHSCCGTRSPRKGYLTEK